MTAIKRATVSKNTKLKKKKIKGESPKKLQLNSM